MSRNQGWVRVRSGATLSKTGSNQIPWNDVNVANDGEIHVSGGTLQLEQNTTFSGGGLLRLDAGGNLESGARLPIVPGLTLNQNRGTARWYVKANVIADGSHVLSSSATRYQSTIFSGDGVLFATGPLAAPMGGGGGGIIKEGTGTLYLTATNTYEGDTVVKQGRLKLSETAALNNASRFASQSGGTLDVTDFASGIYALRPGTGNQRAGWTVPSIVTERLDLTALGIRVITGNLASDHSIVRIGDVATVPSIVSTGLQLNFDAAQDMAGDATWTNAASPGTADTRVLVECFPDGGLRRRFSADCSRLRHCVNGIGFRAERLLRTAEPATQQTGCDFRGRFSRLGYNGRPRPSPL